MNPLVAWQPARADVDAFVDHVFATYSAAEIASAIAWLRFIAERARHG